MQWLIPSSGEGTAGLRRLFALELAHSVFPAGRVLTTEDIGGANLELPPRQLEDGDAASAAIALVPVFGTRLPRASRPQGFFSRNHLHEPHY